MSFAAANMVRFLLVWGIGFGGLWVLAAVFEPKRPRRRRVVDRPPVCAGCGYDLRATPVRCPECGRLAEAAVS